MKRVGIYLRVSTTNGQTTENQRRELEAVAKRSGWQIVGFYEDKGISGAKGREKRPGFDRLLKDATARRSLVGTDSATKSLDLPDTWHRPVHMATRIIETGASTAHQLVEIQVLSTMAASDAQDHGRAVRARTLISRPLARQFLNHFFRIPLISASSNARNFRVRTSPSLAQADCRDRLSIRHFENGDHIVGPLS